MPILIKAEADALPDAAEEQGLSPAPSLWSVISLALNIFSLRWRRRSRTASPPHASLQVAEAVAQKAPELQELRERMLTQERLLQELKELIIMFQGEREGLLEGPQEGLPNAEALAHLQQRYQLTQGKLQEFELRHQVLLPKDEPSRDLFGILTTLFDTLTTLKEDKAQLEHEVERLKGLEEAYLTVQHEARRLENQLSRSQDLVQQLRTKYEHLTKQYSRAFGPHKW